MAGEKKTGILATVIAAIFSGLRQDCNAAKAPNNTWIVTNYNFHRHKTPKAAKKEARRLAKLTGKSFEVLRVNSTVVSSVKEAA